MINNIFGLFKNNDNEEETSKDNADKILYVDNYRCPENHRCPSIRVCPVGALTQERYEAPKVDMEKCIKCGKCVKYCPMRAISLK